jgi:hypothetical protein
MGRLALHRHRGDDSTGARTALVLVTMVLTADQIDQCERSLAWCAENRPSAGEFATAVQELRDAVAARGEE